MLQSQDVWWLVGFFVVTVLTIRLFRKRHRPFVFEFTTSHSLPCTTGRVYSELHDLSNWWQWDARLNSACATKGQPGVGQVLFQATGPPVCGLEIVQAWKDRRLRLLSQSLADGYTRWDQLDLCSEGAFCRLQWNTRWESSARPVRLSFQLKKMKRGHLQVVTRLRQHINYGQQKPNLE